MSMSIIFIYLFNFYIYCISISIKFLHLLYYYISSSIKFLYLFLSLLYFYIYYISNLLYFYIYYLSLPTIFLHILNFCIYSISISTILLSLLNSYIHKISICMKSALLKCRAAWLMLQPPGSLPLAVQPLTLVCICRRAAPSAEFSVDRHRHLMSFLTMLGPSPDWNVGLSAEDLCTKDCGWVQKVVQDLIPWDAGTDSGVTYEVQAPSGISANNK